MAKKPLPEAPGFGATMGDLLRARGLAPTEAATPSEPAPPATSDPLDLRTSGKLVVRRENKGRGGKTVTLIEGLPEASLAALAKALKTALGCGATVEGANLALQGDQTARAIAFLTERGARQVVRGN